MSEELINILKTGGVAVLPTDTIYGLHASVISQPAIEKIYKLKGRDYNKPLIVLISSLEDLDFFGVKLSEKTNEMLEKIWPNPISVVLDTPDSTLAFRMPNNKELLNLLKKTGPLVSTSANPEGQPPAETIEQAKKYFGDQVDYYLDGGELKSSPSTLIKIMADQIEILRQGSLDPKQLLAD